jgi:hypothetical protein
VLLIESSVERIFVELGDMIKKIESEFVKNEYNSDKMYDSPAMLKKTMNDFFRLSNLKPAMNINNNRTKFVNTK